MCYLVRDRQAAPGPEGALPSGGTPPKSRWAAAGAAALVGGLALAAVLAPSGTDPGRPQAQQQRAAPVQPAAAQETATGQPVVLERMTLGIDDDAYAATDSAKAKASCSESL